MRPVRTLLILAAGIAAGALAIPMLASSAPTRNADAITSLQRRVASLERTTANLKKQLVVQGRFDADQVQVNNEQSKVNSSQTGINGTLDARVTALENKPKSSLSVQSYGGIGGSVAPHTWSNLSANCPVGTRIGGAFTSNYPIMVGNDEPSGVATWNVSAFNPFDGDQPFVTPYAICASIN
jgi:hypothetical protein